MDLEAAQREHLVTALLTALQSASPGSHAFLRGSLANGTADAYSDIDLLWDVPDARFASAVAALPAVLARVRPVASLRFDPDFQRSAQRRLVFVRFAGVPLFWRVDLDVCARSAGRDPDLDRDNPAARGTDWSAPESALMNAIAAIKAHLRQRDDEAARLLQRAEHRVHGPTLDGDLPARIERLLAVVAQQDPSLAPLASDIRRLRDRSF